MYGEVIRKVFTLSVGKLDARPPPFELRVTLLPHRHQSGGKAVEGAAIPAPMLYSETCCYMPGNN